MSRRETADRSQLTRACEAYPLDADYGCGSRAEGAHSRLGVGRRIGPAGLHLFDRRSGVNLLLDELRFPSSRWSLAPRQVSVALTNACDLACPYCYAPKSPGRLGFDVLVDWLSELDRHGCLGIGFGGGEPTLFRRFADLCRAVTERTSMAVTFTTHAHRLDERLCAELSGNVNFVRVSMDGVGVTYERLRGRRFDDLRSALDRVSVLAAFGINYVVNAETIADLGAAVGLAAEAGAQEVLLLPEQPVGRRTGVSIDVMRALRQWVVSYAGPVRLALSAAAADGFPTCSPIPGEAPLDAYAHVDAHGVVKQSSYDRDGVAIGADGIIPAILRLRQRREEGL